MNSRERVRCSFRHQSPDRVPRDYLAVPEVDSRLMERFQLPDRESLLRRLQVDFRHLDKWGTTVPQYVGPELPEEPDGTYEDYWGIPHRRVEYQPGCFYDEWVKPPLANATTVSDIDRHRWPKPDWIDFSGVAPYCIQHQEYCIAGGIGATLDMVGFFRGMEQAMLDIYDNPALLEAIIEKLFEFKYAYNLRMLEAARGRMDILFISEDMGGQNGLIVSKEVLKRLVFPNLKKFAELGHRYNARVMLHSDGDIGEIIPELIDAGVDIINPVQPGCPGMEPMRLKREFGKSLCFHGLLDNQNLLPFGTTQEVRAEMRRLVEVAGVDGGLALSPNCGFQVDVPIENILSVYEKENV